MTFALYDAAAPVFVRGLNVLDGLIDKAVASGLDEAGLMEARLAPDMFPLSTQIRFTCMQALEGVSRMRGEAFPPAIATLLSEGREAGEQPGTIAGARARIAETLAALEQDAARDFAFDPQMPIAHELPNGMIFDLTAEQYARDWALPQFYFHLNTAYAILRANGVALGKADYVAHMLPLMRPESMPTG